MIWSGSAVIGVISIVLALTFPPNLLPFAGFGYTLLGAWIPLAIMYRVRSQPGGPRRPSRYYSRYSSSDWFSVTSRKVSHSRNTPVRIVANEYPDEPAFVEHFRSAQLESRPRRMPGRTRHRHRCSGTTASCRFRPARQATRPRSPAAQRNHYRRS